MCGRFSATFSFRDIKVRWNLQGDLSFEPRYNIAPSQSVAVILKGDRGNEVKLMKWGLVPSWASDPSIGNRMINARAETLLGKPSFKRLVSQRRCLIPADGFYEWRREGKRKVPVWIHLKKKEPFTFAGLWDSWRNPELGDVLNTFTIITTDSNTLVRRIHDRMPVIYDDVMGRYWLDENCTVNRPMELAAILQPSPSEYMEAWDVSTLVNAPENDSTACILPAAQSQTLKGQLPLV
jgi:putative SOS response-associated peptidase YedK